MRSLLGYQGSGILMASDIDDYRMYAVFLTLDA